MARAGLPTRSQSHAELRPMLVRHPFCTLVGSDKLSAYVPDGGETVGAAIMLASASDELLLLLLLAASTALLQCC
jgi:hypothetical protein